MIDAKRIEDARQLIASDPLLAVIDWPLMMAATQLVAHSNTREKTLLDVANMYQQLRTKQQMRAEDNAYHALAKGDWRAP